jgi:predicted ABC-type transport system involved in lysophospholipase L1 biosynthesis ATPase subunit
LNSELGTTLLMVTHDADAAAIAGRQLRLNDGQIVMDSGKSETQRRDIPAGV